MDQSPSILSQFETSDVRALGPSSFVPAVEAGRTAPEAAVKRTGRAARQLIAKFGKLRWYAVRLAAMSAAEIGHRIGEQAARRRLRSHKYGWAEFYDEGRLRPLAALQMLAAGTQARPERARQMFLGRERILGRERFLGHEWPAGDFSGKGWFFDPVSKDYWPGADVDAFSIDVRSTSAQPRAGKPYGDVKFVREVNRLQMLHPLARCISANRQDRSALDQALSLIDSWMVANPPYRGVNWSSGIEVALRIVSVSLVVSAAGVENLSASTQARLSSFLEAHARWLAALPSLYSSANNHRVAEGLGLFLAGLLLDGSEAGEYAREGRAILREEAFRQIYADGVGVEQSPSYQAFTMELIALGSIFAQANDLPFEPAVMEHLRAAAAFLIALQDGAGHVPAIGDDDEGRVLTDPAVDEPLYVASVAAAVAQLTGLETGKAAGPGYWREELFGAFAQPSAAVMSNRNLLRFNEGGYGIIRQNMNGRQVHLVFDCGPLGFGSLGAHGHADALAIWLSVGGEQLFVDAGTWLYHSGEKTRNQLRCSQVHNTLTISDRSQSVPSSAFSWSHKARAFWADAPVSMVGSETGADNSLCGSHDGYVQRCGVTHKRCIRTTADSIFIDDRLLGKAGSSDVEISFLCAMDVDVQIKGGKLVLSRQKAGKSLQLMELVPPDGFDVALIQRDFDRSRGVVSPRFGVLAATTQIVLKGRLPHSTQSNGSATPAVTIFRFLPPGPGEGRCP